MPINGRELAKIPARVDRCIGNFATRSRVVHDPHVARHDEEDIAILVVAIHDLFAAAETVPTAAFLERLADLRGQTADERYARERTNFRLCHPQSPTQRFTMVAPANFIVNSQREARVVFGPGGIPLVTDPIQGVFYASGFQALTRKLTDSNIAFNEAEGRCGGGVMGALRRGPDNILAIGAIMLSITGLGLLFRPRAVVQVVVYCGDVIGACAQAIERAVHSIRSKQKDKPEISVTAGKAPAKHEPKTEA